MIVDSILGGVRNTQRVLLRKEIRMIPFVQYVKVSRQMVFSLSCMDDTHWQAHTCTRVYTHAHTRTHTHVHTHAHTHTQTHTRTHTHNPWSRRRHGTQDNRGFQRLGSWRVTRAVETLTPNVDLQRTWRVVVKNLNKICHLEM